MAAQRRPFGRLPSENDVGGPAIRIPGPAQQTQQLPTAQRLPKRTTKTAEKGISLDTQYDQFPSEIPDDEAAPFLSGLPKPGNLLTSKVNRKYLPRVTAYCTAASYNLEKLHVVFDDLRPYDALPTTKRYDEALYTTIDPSRVPIDLSTFIPPSSLNNNIAVTVQPSQLQSHQPHVNHPQVQPTIPDLLQTDLDTRFLDVDDQQVVDARDSFFEQNVDSTGAPLPSSIPMESIAKKIAPVGELFLFDYGVVVCWGLSEFEEKVVLDLIRPFEEESVKPDEIEKEDFVFFYNVLAPPQIFNDIITLRKPSNVKHKLAISHAIAQSTKLTVYEYLVEDTIEGTKSIPETMAMTGRIHMSRGQVNRKIGSLFAMRINVNLVSNVLDAPELLWSEPSLEPLYNAIRLYLEITQRVDLLNQRVQIISDLLEVLKDNMTSSHDEALEWIVIILIATEIVLGVFQMLLDMYVLLLI
ncbi:hypothetical protein SmJEL517_g03427 [Synchytrium microbalum]|uniref:DUF155 domain-containing protein n=1 Tax=Synchytrium microbalum TaxID=1806994 RepID=A0A507C2X6_9FUNG|nr:uncharacterized protein SmJEL517_g03427 [Synchytrium microbalum]TPX33718.1 hypothetical protein SmJEL517_g03427 [Synchytrium microbalum]